MLPSTVEGGQGGQPYPMVPFSLILASSMAKVMWSWCSMPLATRLNATWGQAGNTAAPEELAPHGPPRDQRVLAPYLEEVLRYDRQALCVVCEALQVRVLI